MYSYCYMTCVSLCVCVCVCEYRYSSLLGFINHLSHREKSGCKTSQTNFTTGVRGSLHTNQFLTRLESLGVKNKNTPCVDLRLPRFHYLHDILDT